MMPQRSNGIAVTVLLALATPGAWAHEPTGAPGPAPEGKHEVHMTTPVRLAPGVDVQLLPGQPAGLLLSNRGRESATVLGLQGEACIRIGPEGVAANVNCASWPKFGRAHGPLAAKSGAGEKWITISRASRYSWIDPRTGDGTARRERSWRVPLLVGNQKITIEGVTSWIPAPPDRRTEGEQE
jgi:hypothetical protein